MASAADPACCDAGVYEAWRRNVPFTYDWLCSTFLEWGSLSADFLGVRPLSMAASLRLKAGGDPAKLAATSALVGKAGVAEADLVAKGAYMRGFVFATRTGETHSLRSGEAWGARGSEGPASGPTRRQTRSQAAQRHSHAHPPRASLSPGPFAASRGRVCPASALGAASNAPSRLARSRPLTPADAAFDASRGEWEGIPCWLTVADAVVQRPNTSQPHSLKRIAHATGSSRVLPRRRIVHPGEVNRVR
ncbi:unnamed protein product [Symbiodinium sp. KB8]|nr:unnamed protein product [Symbiodinium sp. KB8]